MPWSTGGNHGTFYTRQMTCLWPRKIDARHGHYKIIEKLIMLFIDHLSLPTLIDKIMAQVIKIVRDGGRGAITLTVHAGLSHTHFSPIPWG